MSKILKSDKIVFVVFLAISFLYHFGRTRGFYSPFIFLGSDAANISTFIMGRLFPEDFKNDFILNDINNFGFYWSLHFPMLKYLTLKLGEAGDAFVFSLGAHCLLQLMGFFYLGKKIFSDRLLAFLFSLTTMGLIHVGVGDYFGFYPDPQFRFTYQAFLPWGLVFALNAKRQSQIYLVMAYFAFIFYFHPVSGLPWGLAVWLGFLFCSEKPNLWKAFMSLFAPGLLFCLLCLPFFLRFFWFRKVNDDYSIDPKIIEFVQEYQQVKFHSVFIALKDFLQQLNAWPVYALIGGSFALWFLGAKTKNTRKTQLFLFGCSTSLLFTTFVVPALDQIITHWLGILPLETDLVRMVRFVPLGLLLLGFFSISRLPSQLLKGGLATALCVMWLYSYWPRPFEWANRCIRQGVSTCQGESWREYEDVFRKLKPHANSETPIFALGNSGLDLRYHGRWPVTYCRKDENMLAYVNLKKFAHWVTVHQAVEKAAKVEDSILRSQQYVQLAKEQGSSFAFFHKGAFENGFDTGIPVLFETQSYVVFDLREDQVK